MDQEHVFWYAILFESGLTAREVNTLWGSWTAKGNEFLAGLFESEPEEWPSSLGVTERTAVESACRSLAAAALVLEPCEKEGIGMVTLADSAYPAVLREALPGKCPPLLFHLGSLEVLDRPTVAIVGSRDASPEGIEFAESVAAGFASAGWNVVSGLAKGVDRAAMGAALEAGGTVTAVLPYGITARRRDLAGVREYLENEQLLILSQFKPTAPWHVGHAMARNSVVSGLSRALVVADAGESGGSWEVARGALKRGQLVYVRAHSVDSCPGLAALTKIGARPLRHNPGFPEEPVEHVLSDLAEGARKKPSSSEPQQGFLFEV